MSLTEESLADFTFRLIDLYEKSLTPAQTIYAALKEREEALKARLSSTESPS